MWFRRGLQHLWVVVGYAVVATGFAWPLPARLGTHLTGPPSGDTGVYVWNLWVFHNELVHEHAFPYLTSAIFSLDPKADLSLHNYTVFANVLGLPLLPHLGVVPAFNLVYLLLTVLAACAMFLLARELVKSVVVAWLAGVLFAFSPALVARSTAHFSLVAAAPLPVFVWLLLRAERSGSRLTGIAIGATVAWAALCDVYYGVFCLMLALFHLAARTLRLELRRHEGPLSPWTHLLTALAGLTAALVGWVAVTGGGQIDLLGWHISVQGLYNPMLVLCVLVFARLAIWTRPRLHLSVPPEIRRLAALLPYGAAVGLALLAPWLYRLIVRVIEGRLVTAPVFWRTSPPGVDLLSFVMTNPSHPLYGAAWRDWLTARPGGFVENVAGIPAVVFLLIGLTLWRTRTSLLRYWTGLTLTFGALALGPFLVVGGINTCIPLPWAFLRYVPIIGSARMPARFSVVTMMGVAALAALAMEHVLSWRAVRQRLALGCVAAVLLFELLPAPRVLYSAVPPRFYQVIAADPRDVRVLELPFGVRDGLSSAGDFSAASQFYQTFHQKPLIGGYLSRVSVRRVETILRRPTLRALLALSEGRHLTPQEIAEVRSRVLDFLAGSRVGYVVIDRSRASPELVSFALDTLDLEKIDEAGSLALYRPVGAVRAAR